MSNFPRLEPVRIEAVSEIHCPTGAIHAPLHKKVQRKSPAMAGLLNEKASSIKRSYVCGLRQGQPEQDPPAPSCPAPVHCRSGA